MNERTAAACLPLKSPPSLALPFVRAVAVAPAPVLLLSSSPWWWLLLLSSSSVCRPSNRIVVVAAAAAAAAVRVVTIDSAPSPNPSLVGARSAWVALDPRNGRRLPCLIFLIGDANALSPPDLVNPPAARGIKRSRSPDTYAEAPLSGTTGEDGMLCSFCVAVHWSPFICVHVTFITRATRANANEYRLMTASSRI